MKSSKALNVSILSAIAAATILGFQNCAPTQFKEAPGATSLSLSVADESELVPQGDIAVEENESEASEPSQVVSQPLPEMSQPSEEIREPGEDIAQAGVDPVLEPKKEEAQEPKAEEVAVVKAPAEEANSQPQEVAASEEMPKEVPAVEMPKEVVPGKEIPKEVVAVAEPSEEEEAEEENIVECDMGRANSKVVLNSILNASPSNASATRVCMSENACLKIINAFAAKRDCSLSKPVSGESDKQCTEIFPGSRGTCKNAAKVSDAEIQAILKNME